MFADFSVLIGRFFLKVDDFFSGSVFQISTEIIPSQEIYIHSLFDLCAKVVEQNILLIMFNIRISYKFK